MRRGGHGKAAPLRHLAAICLAAAMLAGSATLAPRDLTHPANVPVEAGAGARVAALWQLIAQAQADLSTQRLAESDADFLRRYDATRRLMLNIAWFESVDLRYRRQIRGPARSLYQIEPIRALSCCQLAAQRGWMDTLAAACGVSQVEMAAGCAALTPAAWPPGGLVEQCLVTNDRFASTLAHICLEPIPANVPVDLERQAAIWANRWKRTFASPEQRQREMALFIAAAERAAPYLPLPSWP